MLRKSRGSELDLDNEISTCFLQFELVFVAFVSSRGERDQILFFWEGQGGQNANWWQPNLRCIEDLSHPLNCSTFCRPYLGLYPLLKACRVLSLSLTAQRRSYCCCWWWWCTRRCPRGKALSKPNQLHPLRTKTTPWPVLNASVCQGKHGKHEGGGGGASRTSPARPRGGGDGSGGAPGARNKSSAGRGGSGLVSDDCLPSPCIITFGG